MSPTEITQNYYAGYQLALEIIHERFGDHAFADDASDMAQTVFGCEALVRLIETIPFERARYATVISSEIDRVSRELYPDVGKRHFVSIDKLHDEYSFELEEKESASDDSGISQFELLDYVRNRISPQRFAYLERLLKNQTGTERDCVWTSKLFSVIDHSIEYLESQIDRMQRLYPDGLVVQEEPLNVARPISESEAVDCYKNVLLGISRRFPVHFLSHDAPMRCAAVTRYAVENVLEIDALTALRELIPADFAQIGLRGIVRYFNYSVNRMIRNAYPNLLMPWETGHVESGFWDDQENRKLAVRWLMEEKLGFARTEIPEALRADKVTKATFVEHGLSYMFVQHFKSVSKCVGFAYPDLMPWELGSVPNSFWQGDEGRLNIIRAVRWMMNRLEISPESIPDRIRDKTISRATFARFGLATVFERIYKKNMVHIINTAYPGRFEAWEIGRVPAGYWDNLLNGYRAAKWVARKRGLQETEIALALKERRILKSDFENLGLGGMLKTVFDNDLRKAFLPSLIPVKSDRDLFVRDVFLLYILQKQIREVRFPSGLHRLLYGFLIRPLTRSVDEQQLRIYERIRKRIKNRIGEVTAFVIQDR